MDLSLTLCYFLLRFVIPLVLGSVVYFRQNLFSSVYLILLFVAPILPSPTRDNVIAGANGWFLRAIIVLSALINSAHIVFQVVLLIVTHSYVDAFDYCGLTGKLFTLVGLHRYDGLSVGNILRLCCLDFVVLLITCLVYAFAIRTYSSRPALTRERTLADARLSMEPSRRTTEAGVSVESLSSAMAARQAIERQQVALSRRKLMKYKADRLTYYLTEGIFCLLLFIASVLEPSVSSSVYFLYFLFIGSWFALNRRFTLGYQYFRIFIAMFVALHLLAVFLYQLPILQPLLPPERIEARLFGLVNYFNQTCEQAREFDVMHYHFVRFLHPLALMLLYFNAVCLIRSVLISKRYLKHNISAHYRRLESRMSWNGDNDNSYCPSPKPARMLAMGGGGGDTPTLAQYSLSLNEIRAAAASSKPLANDHTPLLKDERSVVNYSSIRLKPKKVPPLPETEETQLDSSLPLGVKQQQPPPQSPGVTGSSQQAAAPENQITLFLIQIWNMIKRGSYVITLIVMMTWSITYHSWSSFVLLLASCVIWMTPNSRQTCLRSSPLLVIYALLLLIGQYVYSLRLDDSELPTSIGNMSISQIGFKKYGQYSYQPLFIKLCYTFLFWITLRQYSESQRKRQLLDQGVFSPLYRIGEEVSSVSIVPEEGPSTSNARNYDDAQSTATGSKGYQSKWFDSFVGFFHEMMIKYWIWVVATMLMIMSLSGDRVVIYRIVYMFLFLTFTLLFQISLKWWRKLMYVFWLLVIFYSMIILIAIYTYQFDNFPNYWQEYLFISKQVQEDLGLVVFDDDAFVLFQELSTPTFFIIITIIQVHFVHKEFLEFSSLTPVVPVHQEQQPHQASRVEVLNTSPTASSSSSTRSPTNSSSSTQEVKLDMEGVDRSPVTQSEVSSLQTIVPKDGDEADNELEIFEEPPRAVRKKTSLRLQLSELSTGSAAGKPAAIGDTSIATTAGGGGGNKRSFCAEVSELLQKCWVKFEDLLNQSMVVVWRLLEIHIIKLVFLCAITISIKDISAMNVIFVMLTVVLMVFTRFERVVCLLFGLWAGVLILLKMLFQLNIAQRIDWNTNCTDSMLANDTAANITAVIDNRLYIGFLKTSDIFDYINEYILLIVILVFRTVIILRQVIYRPVEYPHHTPLEGVVFVEVERKHVDVSFVYFLKYIINFGFYKFGVEICLILLTVSISNRGDIFSVFYCLWALMFVLLNRDGNKTLWTYFVGFLGIVLPYQYLMCLGMPPGLCWDYPWGPYLNKEERVWYFLPAFVQPDFRNDLPTNKLYLDFAILFFACRQLIVFRLEETLASKAGSNLEAYKETTINYEVPDFFAFGLTVFDTIKSFFFFCFYWITLAVLFLAGTTRVNLFGLGYVLGSFIFLWNGNEFYLKPIKLIFKYWKSIIAYTCATMLLKSIVQLFVNTMIKHELCWLVQLLGISYYKAACPTENAGLLWDGTCFTFLLIQKRIFCSHYFKHLVREIKAQHFLASRGAELIHEIQAKEVAEQELAEREVMEKIKQKMDRIKAARQKMFADKAKSIKYHKQEFDYDISPYSGDETLSNASVSDEMLSSTLPTVYSPTPSFPTITSPQSANTLQPEYFEIYKVAPIPAIDASISSATIPSFSFTMPMDKSPFASMRRRRQERRDKMGIGLLAPETGGGGGGDDHSQATSALHGHGSVRTLVSMSKAQQQPPEAVEGRGRKMSIMSHASSVKSGGYYMFEDIDSEVVELNYNVRESLIPDPEGREMRNLAKSKGFTAFCSKLFKGEEVPEADASLVSPEITADIGDSSRDAPIISIERAPVHSDDSKPTTMTSLTSQATDISGLPSLKSKTSGGSKKSEDIVVADTSQEVEVSEEEKPQETYMEKIKGWLNFIRSFFESILISCISSLNSVSRDYRFVAKRLSVEKKALKRVIEIEESQSEHYDCIADQSWRKSALSKLSSVTEETLEKLVKAPARKAMRKWNKLAPAETGGGVGGAAGGSGGGERNYVGTLDPNYLESSIYLHFARSFFYALLSRSEVICYITIVINQIATASILSLPLPLFAFLWGSLSVPRPSKSFWVTSITYIEVVVVIKYIFQFQFWYWRNQVNLSPFWWPRLVGIERKDNYANYDLFLLLVLFFHRFMLKGLGLWDLSETEVKAYMTNAELIQQAEDEQHLEEGSGNGGAGPSGSLGKKLKKKMKKTKSKDVEEEKTAIVSQEQLALAQSTSSSADKILSMYVDPNLAPGEYDEEDEEDNEGANEFNLIYIFMDAPNRLRNRFSMMIKPIIKFFHNVLHPPYRITHDVYSYMFLCDFINFFILVFGFYAFGSGYTGSSDVTKFLEENKIPTGFLITLLIQFAQIIIDRAIYLRKYIKGKLIFQIIIVIFTHMWLFFALPAMTDKPFTHSSNLPPKLWYIFKCVYFLLSAFQIRSGYPTRILGNTFCKKYNFVNWYLFKMYMLIPFVYDLRMYMDWIWTDTSLVLDEWSLMEDIFVNLYQRKCELKIDEEFPEPRGRAKRRLFKYLIGGTWVAIIIALIWGPLGLFAFGRAVGDTNPPIGATIELEIGGFQPLFKMSVTGSGLEKLDDKRWTELNNNFNKDAVAQTFINGYDQQDVYLVNLNGNSTAIWGISPPSQQRMSTELVHQNDTLDMKLTYTLVRKKKMKTQDMDATIYDEKVITLDPIKDRNIRLQISKMINEPKEQEPAIIPFIFPNYLRVPEKGKPTVAKDLFPKGIVDANDPKLGFRNIEILLKKGRYEDNSSTSWWEIHDNCNDTGYLDQFFQDLLRNSKCQYLPIVLFNDKVFIGMLAILSGYGIIGIYTTFVFLVSRWVRGLNSESSFKVIYTRMPNVDRVLQLCLDIYLVRESREFELEEDLYAKLIFLYRSPETLIKWTKQNEEITDATGAGGGGGGGGPGPTGKDVMGKRPYQRK